MKTLVAVTEEVGEFARVLQLQERSARLQSTLSVSQTYIMLLSFY